METKSFSVDHTKLKRGIYRTVSTHKGVTCTTFDLRMVEPVDEEGDAYIAPKAMHLLEHMFANHFRSNTDLDPIYIGPMGCCTGFYFVFPNDNVTSEEVLDEVVIVLKTVANSSFSAARVPAANKFQCGNYLFLNTRASKRIAKQFLTLIHENGLEETYPSL